MEYVQMTLDDWVQMKQKLKQELLGVKQSFVRIGYALRQIDDQKLYEQDKRKMTPMEKKAAKQIVKNLQRGPMNRQERRARERKLRPRKNPRKH